MSGNDPDRELTRMFDEQRREDEGVAPDFRTLLSKRIVKPRRSARAFLVRASAASALLVAGILMLWPSVEGPRHRNRPSDFALPASAAALGSWKAPTDFLLDTPGADLLRRRPVLLADSPASELPPSPSEEK